MDPIRLDFVEHNVKICDKSSLKSNVPVCLGRRYSSCQNVYFEAGSLWL